jgi:SAM-dependent methyltransferase
MPLLPDLRERLVTLPRHASPNFMLDFLSAWGFRVVVLGFRLGILDQLRSGPKTAAELAAATGLQPAGVALVLDALHCLGYVRSRAGRYQNTRITRELLLTLPVGIPYFEQVALRDWDHLEAQLRDGGGVRPVFLDKDWRVFNGGHLALARMNIREVVRRVRLPRTAHRLLDLGGGHGLYSVEFCRRYPRLQATLFEVPPMEKYAQRLIADYELTDRVRFRAGDFLVDDLEPADVILLFNVIHSKSEAENRQVLKRAADSLRPGGLLVLLDQFPVRKLGNLGWAFGALLALSMFSAAGQRTYRPAEVRAWCRDVGLTRIRFLPLRSAPGNGLVLARADG